MDNVKSRIKAQPLRFDWKMPLDYDQRTREQIAIRQASVALSVVLGYAPEPKHWHQVRVSGYLKKLSGGDISIGEFQTRCDILFKFEKLDQPSSNEAGELVLEEARLQRPRPERRRRAEQNKHTRVQTLEQLLPLEVAGLVPRQRWLVGELRKAIPEFDSYESATEYLVGLAYLEALEWDGRDRFEVIGQIQMMAPGGHQPLKVDYYSISGELARIHKSIKRFSAKVPAWGEPGTTAFFFYKAQPKIRQCECSFVPSRDIPAVSRITMQIDPLMSPEEVADAYKRFRSEIEWKQVRDPAWRCPLVSHCFSAGRVKEGEWMRLMVSWNKHHSGLRMFDSVDEFKNIAIESLVSILDPGNIWKKSPIVTGWFE